MAKPGEVRDETSRGRATAQPGDKLGSIEVVETTVKAQIKSINKTNETVTLKLADGNQ